MGEKKQAKHPSEVPDSFRRASFAACTAVRAMGEILADAGFSPTRITAPAWSDLADTHARLAELLAHRPAAATGGGGDGG